MIGLVIGIFWACGTPESVVEAVPASAPVEVAPAIPVGTVPFLGADVRDALDAFPTNRQAFPPLLAIDGKPETAWLYRGPGVFQFPPATVRGFGLTPGFAKTQELYEKNGRPTQIRFRFWTRGADGTAVAADWHEFAIPIVEQLSPDAIQFAIEPLPLAFAVELEALDGVPGRDYPDWFIADVVVVGDLAYSPDTTGKSWVYASPLPNFAPGNLATAPFETYDWATCVAKHPDGRVFTGECNKARRGYDIVGEEKGPKGSTAISRRVRVAEYGPCYALIDDFPYSRVSCLPREK